MTPKPNMMMMLIPSSKSFTEEDVVEDTSPFTAEISKRSISSNALSSMLAARENLNVVEVTQTNALRKLDCAAQQYAWGRIGSNSSVARMKAANSTNFIIEEDSPYAELWVGTHPNGMSQVIDCDTGESCSLKEYVQSDPLLHLGNSKATDLTFLFKVLSINKVLSIQAHPDKELAERLHAEQPKIYKDANHKPEMAVALTDDFEAMCGFRPIAAISANLRKYPEFRTLIGEEIAASLCRLENSEATREVLSDMFYSFNMASKELVDSQLESLMKCLHAKKTEDLSRDDKLMLKLAGQFPGDSGIMAPLMLNHVMLTKGQSFYIGANEPHAYISGEILECMACSDNVVRAGLTPKLKDVDTLVSMLTYKTVIPNITSGKKMDECTTLYAPPVADFAIEVIEVEPYSEYTLKDVKSPSVLLTLSGSGKLVQGNVQSLPAAYGSAAFASANTRTKVVSGPEGIRIVRALSNVHFF
eukprot:CAMPEP_0196812802 /NCGR_PEP_ID=MMETSP1362-20130617/31335_1 /TAXON_ID=163516 /ORGANISM="Leptocylindrus danicus, Strain CCMP1856" /LENGTH=472 /DNA_ID=CAMNT_0042188705 /DNA_START=149 /DNA_END=1567 /DNA_ORIENTATION=-